MFLAGTVVDLYRDADSSDVDEFGDPTETARGTGPYRRGIEASVAEVSEARGAPADLSNDVVRQYAIRLGQRYGVREGDRLHDTRTGFWYQVKQVRAPQALVGVMPVRLVCTRIGA